MDECPFYFSYVLYSSKKDVCINAEDLSSAIRKFKKVYIVEKNIKNMGVVIIRDCNSIRLAVIDFHKINHKNKDKGG